MSRTLPTELLALVAQSASTSVLVAMAQACTTMHAVSVRPLYASIASMSHTRTVQCLRTLASTPHLARLVRIYAIKLTKPTFSPKLPALIARALEQMRDLTELSLQLGTHATSAVLAHAAFRLTKLVCVVASDGTYPVARFLESQPAIESLYVVCRPEGLMDLVPDALPVLRDVAAPLRLLKHLLPTRLDTVTHISSLGTITDRIDIFELAFILSEAPTWPVRGATVGIALGLDLTSKKMDSAKIAAMVSFLGSSAPWIGLLRLEVHHGHVTRELLETFITYSIRDFTALHTLVIMSQPPAEPRPLPLSWRAYIPSHATHYNSPLLVNVPHGQDLALQPSAMVEQGRRVSPPLDVLRDSTEHKIYLAAWRAACPSLERVVFPIGVYTYVKHGESAAVTTKLKEGKEDTSPGESDQTAAVQADRMVCGTARDGENTAREPRVAVLYNGEWVPLENAGKTLPRAHTVSS